MSTTQMAATLFQLQQLDLELDRLTNEHQAITTSLQGNAKLRKLRSDYEVAQEEWQSSLQTQKMRNGPLKIRITVFSNRSNGFTVVLSPILKNCNRYNWRYSDYAPCKIARKSIY